MSNPSKTSYCYYVLGTYCGLGLSSHVKPPVARLSTHSLFMGLYSKTILWSISKYHHRISETEHVVHFMLARGRGPDHKCLGSTFSPCVPWSWGWRHFTWIIFGCFARSLLRHKSTVQPQQETHLPVTRKAHSPYFIMCCAWACRRYLVTRLRNQNRSLFARLIAYFFVLRYYMSHTFPARRPPEHHSMLLFVVVSKGVKLTSDFRTEWCDFTENQTSILWLRQ